jgi:hypothetical protein
VDTEEIEKIRRRFPPQKGISNLFILEADLFLKTFGALTPLPQLFADLWNLKDWYAKDFLEALKRRIDGILA